MLMECWSNGVLGKLKPNTDLLHLLTEDIENHCCIEFMSDRSSLQYSNTPLLLETITGRADYL
jgi:hypothetical protein